MDQAMVQDTVMDPVTHHLTPASAAGMAPIFMAAADSMEAEEA